tara:strand:- start:1783 stop:2334 length:552 start_codon:yes stop_codon:yes gene_type:complete
MFFVLGASGSGKTSVLKKIKLAESHVAYDFDDIGVPQGADKQWRQQATAEWLDKIVASNKESGSCLFGQLVLGEILACCPSKKLSSINVCFLDCNDATRVARLKHRQSPVDQHTLNWASWLRMHHEDPQWEQHVIKENSLKQLNFSCWDQHTSWDELANVYKLDTSDLLIEEVCQQVEKWVSK